MKIVLDFICVFILVMFYFLENICWYS